LHHLFAFTAVLAVLLAIGGRQRIWSTPQFEMPPFVGQLQQGFMFLSQFSSAVAITALGYGVARFRRGLAFFDQPGHWMLVEISLVAVLTLPTLLANRLFDFTAPMKFGDLAMTVALAMGLYSFLFLVAGRVALNVYLTVAKCRESWWRNVFIAKAAEPFTFGLGAIAIIVLAVLAIRKDRELELRRDGLHWCGVYVQLAVSVLTLVAALVGLLTMVLIFTKMWR
jgi:hypothetical protein